MVLADPPYGMAFRSNYRTVRHKPIEGDDGDMGWVERFASAAYSTAKENTAHYVFCSFHGIDTFKRELGKFFNVKNVLVWEKNNTSMGDLRGDFAPKVEFVLFLHRGRRLINGTRDPNIFKFRKTGNRLHPTQKPVDMCSYLIEKFSDAGNTVLDPFLGSGTTAIAAERSGRRWIGIEKEQKYCDITIKRLEEESTLWQKKRKQPKSSK